MENVSVIVSGASSQVGFFLLSRLVKSGFHIHALSRMDKTPPNRIHPLITWHQTDISRGWKGPEIQNASHYIHLAPLWILPDVIGHLFHMGIRRIVAISSTSRFSKMSSKNLQEQEIVKKLIKAEEHVIMECNRNMISWTLFRPTMIYGCGMDRNVTVIAKFIKRFGFFPMVGAGKGYRQPVHADDIAAACETVMHCPVAFNKTYNLSGRQKITFREMVETIFLALDKKPRIVTIPMILVSFFIKLASYSRVYSYITKEMLERVNLDMCFDSFEAQRDFGYSPREFQYRDSVQPGV